jgi:hypothetical protein
MKCVEQIIKLANNKELIHKMSLNNYEYYNQYLRPDKLILNSLSHIAILNQGDKVIK